MHYSLVGLLFEFEFEYEFVYFDYIIARNNKDIITVYYVGCKGLSAWKHQFSFDHWSQAMMNMDSTWMGEMHSLY